MRRSAKALTETTRFGGSNPPRRVMVYIALYLLKSEQTTPSAVYSCKFPQGLKICNNL